MRKKGLLLSKEYRGSRDLNLEYESRRTIYNQVIQRLAKEMKGYVRRLKRLSISIRFDYDSRQLVTIMPLLKSIKHNFVGLVSLQLSLPEGLRLIEEDLPGFRRLFAWLRPTLKHLDLDFAGNGISDMGFPGALGRIIMKNLPKLETLSLAFRKTRFPLNVVRFFINTACHQMAHLRKLSLILQNCVPDDEWFFAQTSLRNNLQCLRLDFDHCILLWNRYLSLLQQETLVACQKLEELFIRIPNDHLYSDDFLSAMKEEFLQKLNLKRFALELSDKLESTWNRYQDMQALEAAEEMRMEELACQIKQKGQGEEEFLLYCEILIDEEDGEELLYEDFDEDLAIDEIESYKEEVENLRKYEELKEIEEQEEAERILLGEEWEELCDMNEMADQDEE